jgi:SET domain
MDSKYQSVLDLKRWLDQIGCVISPKVRYPVEFDRQLYGMIATDNIAPGETLISIKSQAIISSDLLSSSPLQEIFQSHEETFGKSCSDYMDNQFLAFLVYEKLKGQDSKWNLFFNSLPSNPENLSDWAEQEIKELQDPELESDSIIRSKKNLKSYEDILNILKLYPQFFPASLQIEDIIWCWKIIWTRSFMKSTNHSGLVPYADFINHGSSSISFYFIDHHEEAPEHFYEPDEDEMYLNYCLCKLSCRDLYEINFAAYETSDDSMFEKNKKILIEAHALDHKFRPSKPVQKDFEENIKSSDFVVVNGNETHPAGSQIYIEYGNYSNTSLLIHYGFTLPNNYYDHFRLTLTLQSLLTTSQSEHLPLKYKHLSKIVFYLTSRELCGDLLRTLRALTWHPKYTTTSFFSQTDLGLEFKVLGKYKEILKKSIKSFPTTLEHDETIASNSIRHHFAVTIT